MASACQALGPNVAALNDQSEMVSLAREATGLPFWEADDQQRKACCFPSLIIVYSARCGRWRWWSRREVVSRSNRPSLRPFHAHVSGHASLAPDQHRYLKTCHAARIPHRAATPTKTVSILPTQTPAGPHPPEEPLLTGPPRTSTRPMTGDQRGTTAVQEAILLPTKSLDITTTSAVGAAETSLCACASTTRQTTLGELAP